MLVLTRKLNEEVVIAGNIRLKVLEISGNRVRLGISAPNHVPVIRGELMARMCESGTNQPELELVGTSH